MPAYPQPYFPPKFAGQTIKFRVPYSMPGELVVATGGVNVAFPEGTFLQNTELPFEIHSVVLRATQSTLATPFVPLAAPAPGIDKFWRLRMRDLSKNQNITKNAQLAATLTENNTEVWYWPWPYTLIRSEGFDITVDNLLVASNVLRAEITFRGYLIVLSPPSETR